METSQHVNRTFNVIFILFKSSVTHILVMAVYFSQNFTLIFKDFLTISIKTCCICHLLHLELLINNYWFY